MVGDIEDVIGYLALAENVFNSRMSSKAVGSLARRERGHFSPGVRTGGLHEEGLDLGGAIVIGVWSEIKQSRPMG